MEMEELYVNTVQFNKFLEDKGTFRKTGLTPLGEKNIIQKIDQAGILKIDDGYRYKPGHYSTALVIKAILMTDSGIYLADERFHRIDKISVPGGHLQISDYYRDYNSDYILSELTREIWKKTTRSGVHGWEAIPCKTDIYTNFEYCGIGVVDISDKWYCSYTPGIDFCIYVPIHCGVITSHPSLFNFSKIDFSYINSMYSRGYTPSQISSNLKLYCRNDCRLTAFDNVVKPIFDSFDEISKSFKKSN